MIQNNHCSKTVINLQIWPTFASIYSKFPHINQQERRQTTLCYVPIRPRHWHIIETTVTLSSTN